MNFRFKALQKLSEPDDLDAALRLARPRAWVAAWVLALALAAGIVWTFADRLPRVVHGQGVLSAPLGGAVVQTQYAGIVTGVDVAPGTKITIGQTLIVVRDSKGVVHNVAATVAGEVVSVSSAVGQVIAVADAVAAIERFAGTDDSLVAMVVVPAKDAQTVRTGSEVNLGVSTVPTAAFGLLKGTVRAVGTLPFSPAEMQTAFGNAAIVRRLNSTVPYVLVVVALEMDPSTRSGYRWTTASGPPYPVGFQVEVTASIVVSHSRPVDLVLNG